MEIYKIIFNYYINISLQNYYNNLYYWLIRKFTFTISINCYSLEIVN